MTSPKLLASFTVYKVVDDNSIPRVNNSYSIFYTTKYISVNEDNDFIEIFISLYSDTDPLFVYSDIVDNSVLTEDMYNIFIDRYKQELKTSNVDARFHNTILSFIDIFWDLVIKSMLM